MHVTNVFHRVDVTANLCHKFSASMTLDNEHAETRRGSYVASKERGACIHIWYSLRHESATRAVF